MTIAALERARLLSLLSARPGRGHGIGARDLAQMAGLSERDLREAISELRMEGIAICGTPKSGYFIAATPEELEETCAFLRDRAMHSLTLESKLRHVPLPELLGQLRLKT